MPLTARLDDVVVAAGSLARGEWERLRARVQAAPSSLVLACGREATLRVSPAGVQHFVHRRAADACEWGHAPMTAEHAAVQQAILDGCDRAQWVAADEVPIEGWRADVLAARADGVRRAFEVQWSFETLTELRRRDGQRTASGVRTAWFCRTLPAPRADLGGAPVFELRADESGAFSVAIGGGAFPVTEAVEGLLRGRWRHALLARASTRSHASVYVETCWSCEDRFTFWWVDDDQYENIHGDTSRVRRTGLEDEGLWLGERPEGRPEIVAWAAGHAPSHTPVAGLQQRYSRTVGKTYLAFCCPHCRRMQGDGPLQIAIAQGRLGPPLAEAWVSAAIVREDPHWCELECGGELIGADIRRPLSHTLGGLDR